MINITTFVRMSENIERLTFVSASDLGVQLTEHPDDRDWSHSRPDTVKVGIIEWLYMYRESIIDARDIAETTFCEITGNVEITEARNTMDKFYIEDNINE